ncbi:MAG: tRNA 2-selenouridine(34) synthase MnmH [Pseudomonadota bacterium]
MKYPALLPFDEVLPRLARFDAIIDVRTPAEYALDHLPGAINCPVLDDAERVRIGTMYKQVNAFEAKKVGAALVAKNIGRHIETHWLDRPREWQALIYCWRGGNRSGAMAHVLAKIGWPVTQLDGGYKAFRNHVNLALAQAPALSFKVLCGTTGSGKSRLLETLQACGAQVLDLERLAAHRGSVLGDLPSQAQPAQKAFETAIWQHLRQFDPALPVYIESESKKVGGLRVPDALMDAMRASPCVALHLSRANRVRLLMEDYVHFTAQPAMLNAQLDCLVALHGREKISRWQTLANSGQMAQLVDELLAEHYDPAYRRSIDRNFLHVNQAQALELEGIDQPAMLAAARRLLGLV